MVLPLLTVTRMRHKTSADEFGSHTFEEVDEEQLVCSPSQLVLGPRFYRRMQCAVCS